MGKRWEEVGELAIRQFANAPICQSSNLPMGQFANGQRAERDLVISSFVNLAISSLGNLAISPFGNLAISPLGKLTNWPMGTFPLPMPYFADDGG